MIYDTFFNSTILTFDLKNNCIEEIIAIYNLFIIYLIKYFLLNYEHLQIA